VDKLSDFQEKCRAPTAKKKAEYLLIVRKRPLIWRNEPVRDNVSDKANGGIYSAGGFQILALANRVATA
jgi:hypothetical protein